MEADLLRILMGAGQHYVPRVEIAQKLNLDSRTIGFLFQTLLSWGYRIDFHPQQGVRLVALSSTLHLDEVRAKLPSGYFCPLIHVRETRSTMDFLKNLGMTGAPHGQIVIADSQTAGRGRFQRVWKNHPGKALYLSLLLRPPFDRSAYSRLTIGTSVATLEVIERMTGSEIQIKWPNDLMIQNKKIAGMITEASLDSQKRSFAVVGLGLNLLQEKEDFPEELQERATSLFQAFGKKIRPADFLAEWIPHLHQTFEKPFSEVVTLWKARCLTLGQNLQVQNGSQLIYGMAMDLEENGALILRTDAGIYQTIQSGVVVHEGVVEN